MSKVGIMSMQRIANYGSFLQAFALKQLIENLGHSVEFVDYHVGPPLVKDNADNANKYLRKIKSIVYYKSHGYGSKSASLAASPGKYLHKARNVINDNDL